jgi:HEAT repeat protein
LIHMAALRGVDPGPLCSPLLSDPDAKIRSLACSALASTHDVQAAAFLLQALLDPDPTVAQAAGKAAQQVLGPMAVGLLEMPLAQRALAVAKRRAYLTAGAERLAPQGILASPEELSRLVPGEFQMTGIPAMTGKHGQAGPPSIPGFERIQEVLRTSLKGCTVERIALELQCSSGLLHQVINEALGSQRLVRRGEKLFLP